MSAHNVATAKTMIASVRDGRHASRRNNATSTTATEIVIDSLSNVFSNSFHIYQAEIFPTRIRGTAVGIAYSLSRLSGAILPFITVTVLDNLGASTVFIGCAVIMCIVGLDVALLGPRSTGQVLEASSDEMRGRTGRFQRDAAVESGRTAH